MPPRRSPSWLKQPDSEERERLRRLFADDEPVFKPNKTGLRVIPSGHRLVVVTIPMSNALFADEGWQNWTDQAARNEAARQVEKATGVSMYAVDIWNTDLVYMTQKHYDRDTFVYMVYHVRVSWEG